jgi:hypothetical protein
VVQLVLTHQRGAVGVDSSTRRGGVGGRSAEHDHAFGVERMLGTALVLAGLDKGYLLCKSSLQILVQRASAAPWVMRPDRCAPSPTNPLM